MITCIFSHFVISYKCPSIKRRRNYRVPDKISNSVYVVTQNLEIENPIGIARGNHTTKYT